MARSSAPQAELPEMMRQANERLSADHLRLQIGTLPGVYQSFACRYIRPANARGRGAAAIARHCYPRPSPRASGLSSATRPAGGALALGGAGLGAGVDARRGLSCWFLDPPGSCCCRTSRTTASVGAALTRCMPRCCRVTTRASEVASADRARACSSRGQGRDARPGERDPRHGLQSWAGAAHRGRGGRNACAVPAPQVTADTGATVPFEARLAEAEEIYRADLDREDARHDGAGGRWPYRGLPSLRIWPSRTRRTAQWRPCRPRCWSRGEPDIGEDGRRIAPGWNNSLKSDEITTYRVVARMAPLAVIRLLARDVLPHGWRVFSSSRSSRCGDRRALPEPLSRVMRRWRTTCCVSVDRAVGFANLHDKLHRTDLHQTE
jgi:hypothetical protein